MRYTWKTIRATSAMIKIGGVTAMAEIILATWQAIASNSMILFIQLIGGCFAAAGVYFLVQLWTNS